MPQFQLLQPQPGFGEQLGSALGAGLGEGISSRLQKQLEQTQRMKQLSGLKPLYEQVGVKPEEADALISSLPDIKSGIDVLKFLQGQKQLQSYQESLGYKPSETAPEVPDTETSPTEAFSKTGKISSFEPEKTKAEQIKYETKPVLASHQVPPPVSANQIPQHAQTIMQAKQLGFNQNKKLINTIDEEGKKSKELRQLLKRSYQLVHKQGVGGLSGHLQERLGESIPFLKNPNVAEFQRLQKESTVSNFRGDFGARPSQSEFFYITDVYSRAGDTKEAIIRKLVIEDYKAQIKEDRQKIKDKIFNEYGEYPLNLNAMIEERLKPTYDKFLKATGYDEWIKKQHESKPLSDQIMRDYLRKNQNDPEKALEALQKDGYKVIE